MNTTIAHCIAGIALMAGLSSAAADPVKVTLEPTQHQTARLEIHAADGTVVTYDPAQLESLPTYSIETTTPWRKEPAVFEGVLLTDLLERHGLHSVPSILVTAENDFTSVIESAVWSATPILVATRVDGQPHTRRARGPIQFVMAANDYDTMEILKESHLVWMAARIEAGS